MTELAFKTLEKSTLGAASMATYVVIVEIGAITLPTYEWHFIRHHLVS